MLAGSPSPSPSHSPALRANAAPPKSSSSSSSTSARRPHSPHGHGSGRYSQAHSHSPRPHERPRSSSSTSPPSSSAIVQRVPAPAHSTSAAPTSKQTSDAATQYSPPDPISSPTQIRARPSPMMAPVPPTPKRRSPPSPPPPQAHLSPLKPDSSNAAAASELSPSAAKRPRPPQPPVKLLPAAYEQCDVKDLVVLIADMLMELVHFNDEIPLKDGRLTRFHSRAPPAISVLDYLQRLTTHATLPPPILLAMVYYIDRLCALYPAFIISSLTVHRFLIVSATVASKGLSDSFWTNNTYARVGGVSLRELALLELEFLDRVQWRIVPKPEVLVDYYKSLVERSAAYEIEGNGGAAGAAARGKGPAGALDTDGRKSEVQQKQDSGQESESAR